MNNPVDDWSQWISTTDFQRRVLESIEKHRSFPLTTVEEYLAQKRAELARELDGKTLIYLDTKHWVNLCQVVVQSPRLLHVYDEILGLLEQLRGKGRICCPVSLPLFDELMKQSDASTRSVTARTMDYLSGGVCIQSWLVLVKIECARHIQRILQIEKGKQFITPPWTKAAYCAGEHGVGLPQLPIEDKGLMEKVYIDIRWGMTCDDYQKMPGWIPTPHEFAVKWVEETSKAKVMQSGVKPQFKELITQSRNRLLFALKDEIVPVAFNFCRNLSGHPADHISAILDPILLGHDPHALPSVEVVAGLDAGIALDATRRVQPNDMLDYLHSAQALPYCDALFCDNYMAQKMSNRPLEFGKIYQTKIGSRPEELLEYLKELSTSP